MTDSPAEDIRAAERRIAAFRALHHPGRPLLLPNAWDVASARALAAAGVAAVGTTSLGVAAAAGLPDGQGQGREQTLDLVRRLAGLPIPLTVDIEAGFGGSPAAVADLVAALVALGAAGINLEDGRPDGTLTPPEAQAAVIAEIKVRAPYAFVNARIDTHWQRPEPSLPATLDRARTYLAAGADGIFVPGVDGDDRIRALTEALDAPVNVLLPPGWPVDRLAALGVARISTGSLLYRAALHAAVSTARAVAAGGPAPSGLPGYGEINDLASLPDVGRPGGHR
jgi:2-methylisocitrate lyase-like PEP mutase family enzyme